MTPPKSTRSLCSLLALFMLATFPIPAAAELREAEENIVDRRTERLLERLRTSRLGLPASLETDRDIYLLITAGGAFVEVRALARSAVPPQRLAGALKTAVNALPRPVPVEWSSGSDYSAARFAFETARFGSMSGNSSIPIGRFAAALRQERFLPHILFRAPKHAAVAAPTLPSDQTRGYRMYNASSVHC